MSGFLKIRQSTVLLILILILAATLRFYGLNWDSGNYLHPDERMIMMVADKIRLPETSAEWSNVLTPASTLNPGFFAYGSLPLYLLKAVSYLSGADFASMYISGRFLSALFDLGAILILYLLGQSLVNSRVGLLASFFYAISVLPIQLAHFYAVDTPLTFFITLALYQLVLFVKRPSLPRVLIIGLLTGLALATKTSALVLTAPIGIALLFKLFSRPKLLTACLLSFAAAAFTAFSIAEPYALIDFPNFLRQTMAQSQMTKDAFTFPYTLQYVGKTPYWYELKNIFLWGLGPLLAALSFIGAFFFTFKTFRPYLDSRFLILTAFFWIYFAITGRFAIGFMRYMLPLYPLLCLFAAFFFYQLKSLKMLKYLELPILCLLLLWPLSFISIYTQPNTRIQASDWINQNIPPGSTLAVEHWDDQLPLHTAGNFNTETLELYNPDAPDKWDQIKRQLSRSDYLILASHRLYIPLMKLTDCSTLPPYRCYTQTADYYQNLFAGKLDFKKVAEFEVLPTVPLLNLPISDFASDESFTVYDHPKVMIFKKTSS